MSETEEVIQTRSQKAGWAWRVTWGVPAVLIAIGLIYTVGVGGLGFANLGFASIGVVALFGLLLIRPRPATAEPPLASPEQDASSIMG